MGKKSRTKGAAGERELIAALRDELGDLVNPRRNLEQTRTGGGYIEGENEGGDIAGIPGWSVESKRYATATDSDVSGWWSQTVEQSGGKTPALCYRLDRQRWRVVLRASDVIPELSSESDDVTVTTTIPALCTIIRERFTD